MSLLNLLNKAAFSNVKIAISLAFKLQLKDIITSSI
jgi:hypothetical protein